MVPLSIMGVDSEADRLFRGDITWAEFRAWGRDGRGFDMSEAERTMKDAIMCSGPMPLPGEGVSIYGEWITKTVPEQ